ncbi:MAG: response regulator [Anaerolineae bacterium]
MNEGLADEGMTRAEFSEAVRDVLPYLYDPVKLRKSPLLGLLTASGDSAALREILVAGISALQPGPDVPAHSAAWRSYHVLTYRFVEGSSQREVALDLGVSVRQLRRYEHSAVQWLADALWRAHGLDQPANADGGQTVVAPSQGRAEELAWLRQSFPQESSSVADLVAGVLRTVGPLSRAAGVRIMCQVGEGLPAVAGQLGALRQGLVNLLTAAVRAAVGGVVQVAARAAKGEAWLEVRAIASGADGGDDGPIVPVEDDLAMARDLVEAFGGSLTVRTAQAGSNQRVADDVRLLARVTLMQPRELRVLCVDDNADALRLFDRYLQGTRYRPLPLEDPDRVVAMAVEARPDAILLDVMLPGIDGWELLGRLREHPETRGIPVLVCTIMPQEELASALGAAAFIRKPVTRDQLLAALDQALP